MPRNCSQLGCRLSKQIVARYFAMWNTDDWSIALEVLSPEWVDLPIRRWPVRRACSKLSRRSERLIDGPSGVLSPHQRPHAEPRALPPLVHRKRRRVLLPVHDQPTTATMSTAVTTRSTAPSPSSRARNVVRLLVLTMTAQSRRSIGAPA